MFVISGSSLYPGFIIERLCLYSMSFHVHLREYICMYVPTICIYGTFHKKLDDEWRSNCCAYGDRPGIDRCTYSVRTGDVCAYTVFSLAGAFAISLWLLPLHLVMKFITLCS